MKQHAICNAIYTKMHSITLRFLQFYRLGFHHFLIIQNELKEEHNEERSNRNEACDSFSPVAISSPHSSSFEEYIQNQRVSRPSNNYLHISFDALETGTDSTLDSINQIVSDIETNYDDLISRNNSTHLRSGLLNNLSHRKKADVSIDIDPPLDKHSHLAMSEDTGYQSYSSSQSLRKENIKNSKNKTRDHIFTRSSFQSFECNEFCCITYIAQLFVVIETDSNNVIPRILSDSITSDYDNDESTSEEKSDIIRKPLSRLNQNKKRISSSTKTLRRLMLKNTTVSASGCRIRRNNARESKVSPTQSGSNRMQTPHMKSYIALRQQCRINDDLSPLGRMKGLTPYLKSPVESGALRKSKLKRKKAFKMLNESDNIGKVRQKIVKKGYRSKMEERSAIDSSSFCLSTSTSMESLIHSISVSSLVCLLSQLEIMLKRCRMDVHTTSQ